VDLDLAIGGLVRVGVRGRFVFTDVWWQETLCGPLD